MARITFSTSGNGRGRILSASLWTLCSLLVATGSGCMLNRAVNDHDYATYGGIFQRDDQRVGRVGSVLSDPNLMGTVIEAPHEEVIIEEAVSEEEVMIDSIIAEDEFVEQEIWTGRTSEEPVIIHEDVEVIFDEEIQ